MGLGSIGEIWGTCNVFRPMMYSSICWLFSSWPHVAELRANTFNWSLAVYLGAMFILMGWWGLKTMRTFTGPTLHDVPFYGFCFGSLMRGSLRVTGLGDAKAEVTNQQRGNSGTAPNYKRHMRKVPW